MQEKKQNKSYLAITSTARRLFWKYGVNRVSVEEIAKEAGVSKMTFYRCFKNKVELVCVILTEIFSTAAQGYQAIMDSELPFSEKVEQLVLLEYESSKGISEEFVRDVFSSEQPEWKALIEKYYIESEKALMRDFKIAQKQGYIRQELSMEFILFMLKDLQRKGNDPHFLALYKDKLETAFSELVRFFFHGITPIDNQNNA